MFGGTASDARPLAAAVLKPERVTCLNRTCHSGVTEHFIACFGNWLAQSAMTGVGGEERILKQFFELVEALGI